jgi:hypothetical protein
LIPIDPHPAQYDILRTSFLDPRALLWQNRVPRVCTQEVRDAQGVGEGPRIVNDDRYDGAQDPNEANRLFMETSKLLTTTTRHVGEVLRSV